MNALLKLLPSVVAVAVASWGGELAIRAVLAVQPRLQFKDRALRDELACRIMESLCCVAIAVLGTSWAVLHILRGSASLWDRSTCSDALFTVMTGYFAGHLVRVLQVPGLPRLLITHHLGLVVACGCARLTGAFHVYGLCLTIPVATAAIRNVEWTARYFPDRFPAPSRTATSLLYIVMEGLPPVLAYGHFFLFGWQGKPLPLLVWWLEFVPATATSLVAVYVVFVVGQRLLRERRRRQTITSHGHTGLRFAPPASYARAVG